MPSKPGPLRPHEERGDYSRRLPVDGLPGEPGLGDSFLIVTEGEVTERQYFECIRTKLQLGTALVRVEHPYRTDAEGLVREAIALRNKGSFDHVWVLFDTDIPKRRGNLKSVLELARRENIRVGHSTPSAEVWLLLHFRDRPGPLMDSLSAERAVGEAWGLGYDKSASTFSALWNALRPSVGKAVHRGMQLRKFHAGAETPFPHDPSTELDLLVRALDASVQPQMRILR